MYENIGNLKSRLKPTDHRQGQLVKLVDAIQELVELKHHKDLFVGKDFSYNPEIVNKMLEIFDELRTWDITEVGDLYLTTGGRVVIDKGYGEYFTDGDTKIFTRAELQSGMKYDKFLKRLKEVRKRK